MRILITGGAGYLGSVIATLALQQGYNVRVADVLWFEKKAPLMYSDNPRYEFLKADITNGDLLDKCLEQVDFIIHAASVVGEPACKKFPELTYKTNFEASINLISKALNYGIKSFIFLSTCSNYGISGGLATEKAPLRPLSLYAQTKVNVEKYLMENVRGLDWVILRLSTVYGSSPRMRFDLTVNDFAMRAFTERSLDIFLAHTYRPYIHILDAANVILKLIDRFNDVKNNVFNVGFNSENYQKIQIAEIVKRFIADVRIEFVEKAVDARDYQVDFSRLNKYLGLKNAYSIEDGVKEVIDLLRSDAIDNPLDDKYYNTSIQLGDGK